MSVLTFPYKIIDLTHSLQEKMPSWDGECGFQKVVISDYSDDLSSISFRVQKIKLFAGIGTHMDAPAHCVAGGKTIAQLLPTDLISPCVVIDVSFQAHERYSVSVDDIHKYEKSYGTIHSGCFVMIRTGWEQFWNKPEKYRNKHVFPSVSEAAAELLLQRKIIGLGIDTLSPDRPEDGYPVHLLLLGAGKYIVENATNLGELPCTGSFIAALPIKIKEGTEAPIRLIGLIPTS